MGPLRHPPAVTWGWARLADAAKPRSHAAWQVVDSIVTVRWLKTWICAAFGALCRGWEYPEQSRTGEAGDNRTPTSTPLMSRCVVDSLNHFAATALLSPRQRNDSTNSWLRPSGHRYGGQAQMSPEEQYIRPPSLRVYLESGGDLTGFALLDSLVEAVVVARR